MVRKNFIIHEEFFLPLKCPLGSALTWYGIVRVDFPRGTATGSYVVDHDDPVIFTWKGLPSGANTTQYNQNIFETSHYPYDLHKITVFHNGNSSTTPLTLDYLLVQNVHSTLSVLPRTFLSANSEADPSTDSSSGSYNIGEIVGLTIGTLVMLSFSLYAFFYYRRRSRRPKKTKPENFNLYDDYIVEPFYLPPASHPGRIVQSHASFTPWQARRDGKMNFRRGAIHNRDTTEHVRLPLPSDPLPGRSLPPNLNNGMLSPLMVHEDSGVRLQFSSGSEDAVAEVPPAYSTG